MRAVTILAVLIWSSSLHAAFQCEVTVNRVLVYADGSVNILHTGRSDYTYICNTNGTWKDVDTVTCALWVGMLQGAQNNGKLVQFYYEGTGSCATLPTYSSAPAPVYIGVLN